MPRFGVTITRDDAGVGASALKLGAVDVGGGAYLIEFTASALPNVGYTVDVAMCPPINTTAAVKSTTAVAVAPVEDTPEGAACAGGTVLSKSPWTFATVGGVLRSACYTLSGDYLSSGFSAG